MSKPYALKFDGTQYVLSKPYLGKKGEELHMILGYIDKGGKRKTPMSDEEVVANIIAERLIGEEIGNLRAKCRKKANEITADLFETMKEK